MKDPYQSLATDLAERRCIVIAGLPGTGKSLAVRELARRASAIGRKPHLLQWDIVRGAWDTEENLARFPEIDGVTHPCIRKALGIWVRPTVARWLRDHETVNDLLIIEAPLVGGRFAELAYCAEDALEPSLTSKDVLFLVLVPSRRLQQELRRRRGEESSPGQEDLEKRNAIVSVLDATVAALERVAPALGITPSTPGSYDPKLLLDVMQAALRHRSLRALHLDEVIDTAGSVYDLGNGVTRIEAERGDIAVSMQRAAALDQDRLRQDLELRWACT